jgi:hypothetical protein
MKSYLFVKVILMQRGSNEEGHKGLYSLNFTSKEQEQNDDSYTVAFEDQADANNFCFLLESYFEDLGDNFSANAVPMSIQVRISAFTANKNLYAVTYLLKCLIVLVEPCTC